MKSRVIGYVASEYPALSHTFIEREIRALRESGRTVVTASIRRPNAAHIERMTDHERAEVERTVYVKEGLTTLSGLLRVASTVVRRPLTSLRIVVRAFALSRRGFHSATKAAGYALEALLLRQWICEHEIAHLHGHFANPAATVAVLAVAASECDLSLSVHGPDVFDNVQANNLPEKFKACRLIRVISHYCESQVCRWLPADEWSKCRIVRCGIFADVFSPRPPPNNVIPEILCVGRLVPAKGQHVLLTAAARLKDAGVNFHVTFVGDGTDRVTMEARVDELGLRECVEFTGAVGQDDVHRYYDRADVFVLPSFAEGVPVVLMEAMAKQIPVVSTRITGIPELIDHGENGLLTVASDAEGLSETLRRLLADPTLQLRLAENARRRVLELYNLPVNIEHMVAFFDELDNGDAA